MWYAVYLTLGQACSEQCFHVFIFKGASLSAWDFPFFHSELTDASESPTKHSWSATMPRKFVKNICIASLLKLLIFQLTSEYWKSSKHRTTCQCYLNLFSAKALIHAVFSCLAIQGSRRDCPITLLNPFLLVLISSFSSSITHGHDSLYMTPPMVMMAL